MEQQNNNIARWELAGHGKFRLMVNNAGECELVLCETQFTKQQDFPAKMMNALINAGIITSGDARTTLIFQPSLLTRKGDDISVSGLPQGAECSQCLAKTCQQPQIPNAHCTQSHGKRDCNKE